MTLIYIVIGIGLLILQIMLIVSFFQIASDVRKISKPKDALFYIEAAEMETYLGNKSAALENYKRAKFRYEFKEKYIKDGKDYTKTRIIEIDNRITELNN